MNFSHAKSRATYSFDTDQLYLILSALKDARESVLAHAKASDDEDRPHWQAEYNRLDSLIDEIRCIPWIVDYDADEEDYDCHGPTI